MNCNVIKYNKFFKDKETIEADSNEGAEKSLACGLLSLALGNG